MYLGAYATAQVYVYACMFIYIRMNGYLILS